MCALLVKLEFPALKTLRSARDLTCNSLPRKKCAQACIDCCDEDAGESRVRSSNRQVIPCHLWNSANSSPPVAPASCSAHSASVRSVPHFPPNISPPVDYLSNWANPLSHRSKLFTNTIKNILRPSANYKALLVRQRVDHEGLKLMSLLWDELSSDEVSDRDPQAA